MTSPSQREETLFHAASQLTGDARDFFLKAACAADAPLHEKLLHRLHEHEQSTLPAPAPPQPSVQPFPEPLVETSGQRIGRYKLREKIGEGGCGIVYVAEQEEPVRRRVALKVIKLGMDTAQVIARFEAERQALAMMDHPNIAKVLDAGSTENGRPYFVMELVRGVRITEYCDTHQLTTRERIDLFIQVCHAIQHAHQKGIIHRDIKPSNILVTVNDGQPVPKVIDFGIAKATQGRLTDLTVYTELNQFIGTPAYMSPEQAEMTSLDIDTRSDIYSLGVLLYELLTGKPPFETQDLLHLGIDEMRRTIREKEPPRPSTRFATMTRSEQTTAAERRRSDTPKLIHLLKGDLDWIAMKALEKDRTRRYETANALAADIQRHLHHEPVQARPPSSAYRIGKLIRRNRLAFAGAAFIALGFLISTYLFIREKSARQRAEIAETRQTEERLRAETNAEKARQAALQSRRSQYVSDLVATEFALQSGNYRRAREMLREYFPKNGEEELRGFEWRRWWKLSEGDQLKTFAYPAEILDMAWSPDGQLIAAAGSDFKVRILHSDTGELLTTLTNHTGRAVSVAFSFDGREVASAAEDGLVHFWNVQNGTIRFSLTNTRPRIACSPNSPRLAMGTHGDEWGQQGGDVHIVDTTSGNILRVLKKAGDRMAFTPDGKRLVSGNGQVARVILWDVGSGRELSALGNLYQTLGITFSRDGQMAAMGDRYGRITLWNLKTFESEILRQPTVDFARSVAFSADGQFLAAGMQTHDVEIWDVPKRKLSHRLRGNTAQVWSVAYTPDGSQLASAGEDGTIRLWNPAPPAAQKSPIPKLRLDNYFWVGHPIFSPNSQILAAPIANGKIQLVDPTTTDWPARIIITNGGWPVSFSQDSRTLLTLSLDLTTMHRWNVASGAIRASTSLANTNSNWQFSATTFDGSMLAMATENLVELFDTQRGNSIDRFECPVYARNLEFSPNSKELAISGGDGTAAFWDIAARKVIRTLPGHNINLSSLRYSPDGKTVAATYWDGSVRIWDLESTKQLASLNGHKAGAMTSVFSPDGRTLVSGSDDRTVRFWNMATFREITSIPTDGCVYFLRFSPDGQILTAGNSLLELRYWHAPTLSQIDAAGKR